MLSKLQLVSRVLSVAVLLSALCFGQTQTARLIGTVHDASGAVVPNAHVTAVNSATRVKTETTTNASGDYVLPALQPGNYSLSVEASGFRKAVVEAIELDAAANISQAVTLEDRPVDRGGRSDRQHGQRADG